METLVIWLQLISALALLSDAYMPESARKHLDDNIKAALGGYCDTYRSKLMHRDLGFLIAFVVAWGLFFAIGYLGQWITPLSSFLEESLGLSYVGLTLLLVWAIGFLYVFSIAMSVFSHLDKLLDIVIKFPAAYALYKAPKGPLYAGGFALLVLSHLIQLAIVGG